MRAGVPCSRYRTVGEAMASPQVAARGLLATLGEGDDRFRVANMPFKLSATPAAARPCLAGLGEHTDEVLGECLGVDAERRAALRREGAFGAVTA